MGKACVVCVEGGVTYEDEVWIFIGWISSEWLAIERDIARRALTCGHNVVLVDVTDFSYPPCSHKVSDFDWGMASSPGGKLRILKLKRSIGPFLGQSTVTKGWVDESVSSELLSKYKGMANFFAAPFVWGERRLLERAAKDLYLQLSRKDACWGAIWCFPNGRFSHQRAILESAKQNGVKSICYERNRNLGKYFLRAYTVHDRTALNKDFKQYLSQSPVVGVEVDAWLADRKTPSSMNNFFARHLTEGASSETQSPQLKPNLVYFTSSQDELEGLGSSWGMYSWRSQFESIEELAKITAEDFDFCVRVHPNMMYKSSREKLRDLRHLRRLKSLNISVIGPFSKTNSYELIDSADVVATFRSTVGIEALAQGKRVIATANTYYDQVSSLVKFCSLDDTPKVRSVLSHSVDAREARLWIAFQLERDVELISLPSMLPSCFRNKARGLRKFMTYYFYLTAFVHEILEYLPNLYLDLTLKRLDKS